MNAITAPVRNFFGHLSGRQRKLFVAFLAVLTLFATSGSACTSEEYDKREATQQQKKDATGNTQEKANLHEKIKRDEASANKVGYVYLMSFGKFIGYYTVKGKVSSNGSQLTEEDNIICAKSDASECVAVDGPQDDGTYGAGDPGVFFFTTEGAMVVTSLDYLYADQPIAASGVDVPLLNKR